MDANQNVGGANPAPVIYLAGVYATSYITGAGGPVGNTVPTQIVVGIPFSLSARWTGTQVYNRADAVDGTPGSWSNATTGFTNYSFGNVQGTGTGPLDVAFAVFAGKAYVTADFTGLSLYTNHKFGL